MCFVKFAWSQISNKTVRNLNSVGVVDLFFSLLIAICCMFRNSARYKANVIVINMQISRADLKESL